MNMRGNRNEMRDFSDGFFFLFFLLCESFVVHPWALPSSFLFFASPWLRYQKKKGKNKKLMACSCGGEPERPTHLGVWLFVYFLFVVFNF